MISIDETTTIGGHMFAMIHPQDGMEQKGSQESDWESKNEPTFTRVQHQQGRRQQPSRNQSQTTSAPKKQRPDSGPECSPQNVWTHSGSTRFAGSIGDLITGPDFEPWPTNTF